MSKKSGIYFVMSQWTAWTDDPAENKPKYKVERCGQMFKLVKYESLKRTAEYRKSYDRFYERGR